MQTEHNLLAGRQHAKKSCVQVCSKPELPPPFFSGRLPEGQFCCDSDNSGAGA